MPRIFSQINLLSSQIKEKHKHISDNVELARVAKMKDVTATKELNELRKQDQMDSL